MKVHYKKVFKRLSRNIPAIIILLFAWLIFIAKINLLNCILGFLICTIPVTIFPELFSKIITPKAYKRLPFLLIFLLYILVEIFLACYRMAYFAINFNIPRKASVYCYEYSLKQSPSIFFLATVITLTPGTLVLDLVKEKNLLYIHSLDYFSKSKEDIMSNIELMEKLLRRIFE